MEEKTHTRLFVSDGLATNSGLVLNRDRSHYLGHVLRLRAGAPVAVFNGRDGEWLARIDAILKGRATLTVEHRIREQAPESGPALIFAPIKKTPLDFLVQKATELGASALMPAITRRTVVRRVKIERMRANAIEAAEQCGRLTAPRIDAPLPLSRIIEDWPPARQILLCAESGTAIPILDALLEAGREPAAAIVTGPEGGFEESELDALVELPFVTAVGLGPRLLRADTAALAALVCWQAATGGWKSRPPESI